MDTPIPTTSDLQSILTNSFMFAKQQKHIVTTSEHFSYICLEKNKELNEVINELSENKTEKIVQEILDYITKTTPQSISKTTVSSKILLTLQDLYQNHVSNNDNQPVSSEELFLELIQDETFTKYILGQYGISKEIIKEKLKTKQETEFIQNYCIDLNKKAEGNKIDNIIGREIEIHKILRTLTRRKKNNPILVGEAGVGKTAIVEGLANKIINKECRKDLNIFALDMGSLIAGTTYRGQFEDRLKGVVHEAKNIENSVLFIDEIHTIVGAGTGSNSTLDAANILKPALTDENLSIIGSTTYDEYKKIEGDAALNRRFNKIDVREPTTNETIEILKGLNYRFKESYNINLPDNVIESAVEICHSYLTNRKFPDKAIDILDETCAEQVLKSKKKITEKDVRKIVSSIVEIPENQMKVNSKHNKILKLNSKLKQVIFGQDDAIDTIWNKIVLSYSGLKDLEKPICSLLFTGPTGVGKTELSYQVSRELGINFARFDMSEFSEKNSVSKLIGTSPGYVGFEENGLLSEEIRRNPHTVLVLDEIEKADNSIYDILLQIMDYAKLTDNKNNKIDFKNVILIMTSNVSKNNSDNNNAIGFQVNPDQEEIKKKDEAVKQHFNPEFINRIDNIIQFNKLDKKVMKSILNKELNDVRRKLQKKEIKISISESVKEELLEKGFSEQYGARPLRKVIESEILIPCSKLILEKVPKKISITKDKITAN